MRPGGNRRSSRILSSQPQDTPTPKEPAAARIVSERSGAEAGGKRRPRAWLCQPGSITCRPFLASLGISERHARGKGAPQSDQEKNGLITEEGKNTKKTLYEAYSDGIAPHIFTRGNTPPLSYFQLYQVIWGSAKWGICENRRLGWAARSSWPMIRVTGV